MNNNSIFVGVIIGLLIFFLGYISKSNLFNRTQKVIIIIFSILFFPGGILLAIILYLFNLRNKIYNSNESTENKLALLNESYSKGIITEEEYVSKKKMLSTSVDNSTQLLKLYKAGLLTKDEFNSKTNSIISNPISHHFNSKQFISVFTFLIFLIATIICLIFIFNDSQDNEIYNNSDSIEQFNNDDENLEENENNENDYRNSSEIYVKEEIIEPMIFVFYSANVDDRSKPIIIEPEFSLYDKKTVCTKIYEIKNVDFYQFDERIKDHLLSSENINNATVYKYNSYKEAYDKKNSISEGVIQTTLFDIKFYEYSR